MDVIKIKTFFLLPVLQDRKGNGEEKNSGTLGSYANFILLV